jgi:hypothetical protein
MFSGGLAVAPTLGYPLRTGTGAYSTVVGAFDCLALDLAYRKLRCARPAMSCMYTHKIATLNQHHDPPLSQPLLTHPPIAPSVLVHYQRSATESPPMPPMRTTRAPRARAGGFPCPREHTHHALMCSSSSSSNAVKRKPICTPSSKRMSAPPVCKATTTPD